MSNEKEILALEDKRYAAMCGGDFAALEAMLDDELLYTHSSGLTDTKATWLASLRSGKTKYKSTACSDRKVRLVGSEMCIRDRFPALRRFCPGVEEHEFQAARLAVDLRLDRRATCDERGVAREAYLVIAADRALVLRLS